jgi:hypothetical protein
VDQDEFDQLVARARERARALSDRPYPVLVCAECARLTGWLDGGGMCERCARARELRTAWSRPHGEWVDLTDERTGRSASRSRLGLVSLLGRRKAREQVVKSWLAHVDPGATGPVEPEVGFELEGAHRDEAEAPDHSCILVRFTAARRRFDGESWSRLDGTRIPHDELWLPAEFPASIPIEQLAEAWADYTAAVDSFNRSSWRAEDERRAAEEQSEAEREEALRAQRQTSELLPEEED